MAFCSVFLRSGISALLILSSVCLASCQTTPPPHRVDDRINLDGRDWERRTTSKPEIRFSKLIPLEQDFHAWEERIEVALIPVSISDRTIQDFKERRRYELLRACPTGYWNILKSEKDLVVYEFRHLRCEPYEHRLVVMQREKNRGLLFVYRSRKKLEEEEKDKWIRYGRNVSRWGL